MKRRLTAEELESVSAQRWKLVDGDVELNGAQLAHKLLRMRTFDDPILALNSVAIGGCINTGVSSYQRQDDQAPAADDEGGELQPA